MINCQDCKFFNPRDDVTSGPGWCDITLPPWANPDNNLPDGISVCRDVGFLTGCDLGVPDE